ncbi:OsmC family protein [Shewanella algicola]|uniref:OsmC family protein n=1 Tax=Shewanella algicola TaxID=640633 RepID=UPI00249593CB|nr:OsmC family protein [Shewanella algicola]
MKTQLSTLATLIAILTSGYAVSAPNDEGQTEKIYQVETRLDNYTRPTTFTPVKAVAENGAISENIITSTQNILNPKAPFLKKGMVKVEGENAFSPWQLVSDEGGADHDQTAPNPLTYYAVGSASSLLTQLERAIQVLDLDVEDVKVESKIFFRWQDTMTSTWSGHTDKVISNILITSDESPEKIKELKQMALNAWAVGEGLANKTVIDSDIIVNADDWAGLKPSHGKVETPVSLDNGFPITNVTADLTFQTMEIEQDLALDMHHLANPLVFPEIAIAESAHDTDRPYMHRVRAKSLTENYATWDLYSDDSRGYEGKDKAPTSRDYFTIGTSFCLMSQLTANKMYFQKQGVNIEDFRVEHQFNFQQENFMTPAMTGTLDNVITRIVVQSDSVAEQAIKYAKQSLRTCFAGEGIQNATEMETDIYLNGKLLK